MIDESDFWSASDQLALIHQWARARYAAPWAVFFAVLLRVSASTGPHVQLPGVIGGRASLNLLCAFVAPSGGGKGVSDKVARLAWPTEIKELPIGSGEGIAETFTLRGKESEDNERVTSAIFSCPEIDILTGLESRQGSTILGTLKAFAMGEQLGSTNASKANSRNVGAHTYRGCLSVSAQPGHTGVIFSDASGGTPQRFLWALTIDPDMPDSPVADPGPLNHALPGLLTRRHDDPSIVTEIVYGPDEIRQSIIAAHLARQRGEGDALDGHWMLTRLKVAAVLAIMHHRTVVSDLDWQLSETVMAMSDRTRNWIVEQARQAARAKIRDRAISRAVFDETVDRRRLDTVRNRVLKVLADGQISRGDLRARMGKREYRELLEAALAELAAEGRIRGISAPQGGMRFELNREFSPEPEFSPQISRSEPLNREFSPEPEASITELESRRSYTKQDGNPSCQDWLYRHLDQLLSEGTKYLESFAGYTAGAEAGYSKSAIGNAVHLARAAGRIRTAGKNGRTEIWCIDPAEHISYQPLDVFISRYLDALTANITEVDQAHFYAAADAAGIDRSTARKALVRDSGRIDSQPAHGDSKTDRIWLIIQPDGEASA